MTRHGHHHNHHHHHEYHYEQRVNRSNRVTVPHTTDSTVIFPQVNGTFDRTYNPVYTDCRVPPEQVNEVLSIIDTVVKQHLAAVNCLGIILLFNFIGIFLSAVLIRDPYLKRNIIIGNCVSVFVLAIITGVLRQKRINQARIICQQTLDVHNQRLASVGVRWALPYHFPMWVELHNDFKMIPGYVGTNLIQPTLVIQQPSAIVVQQPQLQFPQTQVQFQQPGAQVQFQQNGYPNNYYNPPQQFNQQVGF